MDQLDEVIHKESIILEGYFESVRTKIENDPLFSQSASLCEFKDGILVFRTEYLHPIVDPRGRIPVMLLFSNPHPASVSRGMFLSEPRSLSFWRRLFDCQALYCSPELDSAIRFWSETSVKVLKKSLIKGNYGGQVLIHMDCLESLPTNQFADLHKLFPGYAGHTFRQQVLQKPSIKRMMHAYRNQGCKHWIVFSVAAYRELAKDKSLAKNGPRRIREALDKWLINGSMDSLWRDLSDMQRTIEIDGSTVNLYLSLIARDKHWKTTDGRYYFTLMLDRIIERIKTMIISSSLFMLA